jgi:ATP-dependent RNA helicase SUPV3L1/SUV3
VPLADATQSVALLGPTNTGKTHHAVERMLEHATGMLGLPLRLLAREIYDRVSSRIGEDRVALVTGEEKRVPRRPEYWICTTEAMPLGRDVEFLAVDEVQLATHPERGHVFTERLLSARGQRETWFLGAATMRGVLERLVPAARHETRPRLSKLSFTGSSKLSRLRPRSAVVGFSVKELYALAGRLRSLRGGTAVVLGALSPRTRNAQVALFQSGEVDYLVATDAIGMGLNLDVQHVAFASLRKFDGQGARALDPAELAQIAGRAGRFLRDGTFGTVLPLELNRELALNVEEHRFEPVRRVRWRNSELEFSSGQALLECLKAPAKASYLANVPGAEDLRALETLLAREDVARHSRSPDALRLLWDVCQIPDFRRILFEVHVDLLARLFQKLRIAPLGNDFMAAELAEFDDAAGDVDTLVARISRLRTWAFVANQAAWVQEPETWQARSRELEDRLSDALHTSLVERFVEHRARSHAFARPAPRSLPAPVEPSARPEAAHPFAQLEKLRAKLSLPRASGSVDTEHELWIEAPHEAFELLRDGQIRVRGALLGRLVRGTALNLPDVRLFDNQALGAGVRVRLQRRSLAFARDVVSRLLHGVRELGRSEVAALRAIAYQLDQGLGSAARAGLEPSLATLSAEDLELLSVLGVQVGSLAVYAPELLRGPMLLTRAALLTAYEPAPDLPAELGRPSYPAGRLAHASWLALGYVVLGPRALRVDLAERAAEAAAEGAPPYRVLASFGVPRTERAAVARALGAQSKASLPPADVSAR